MPSERGLSHCALLCPVRRNATGVDVARDQAAFRHVVMIARLNQTLLADDYRPAAATSRLSESWTLGTSRREIGQGALGVLALVVYRFLTPSGDCSRRWRPSVSSPWCIWRQARSLLRTMAAKSI